METTIENPVIKDEGDELRNQLRDMAEEAGPLTGNEFEPEPSATKPEPAQPETVEKKPDEGEIKPDNSETDPERAKERPRDALGRFTKTETGEDIPEDKRQPAEQEKPAQTVSEYEQKKAEKKQKEQERLDRTWQNVDLRKQELEQRERELAQREQQMRQQVQQPQPKPTQQRQFSSQELVAAHKDFKARAKEALKNGDYDVFNENEALAEQAIVHAQQFYQVEQQEAHQAQEEQYRALWYSKMAEVAKDEPDLMNPQSPLCQAMQKLLQEHGTFLYGNPDGFKYGLEFVKKQMAAESVSELRDENQKLKAENARLNGSLSLSGSGPSGGPTPAKKFDDMSLDEMKEQLRGVAENAGSLATA
jgi:hypothetical protein